MMIKKRLMAYTMILLLVFGSGLSAFAASVSNRLAGEDRYRTAVEISKAGWDTSQNVVLVTGEDYPDALCAAPLSKRLDAPILLTEKTALNVYTESEITRLGAGKVFIIGGTGVISETVKKALEAKGITCTRIYGSDRYETAVAVAKYMDANYTASREIAVVTGEAFADALSISPIAAVKGMPVILVPRDTLPVSVRDYINSKQVEKTFIMGGRDVVSDSVAGQLPYAERIEGYDKYVRNIAVLNMFSSYINYETLYVANGEDYPDALAGSALAAKFSSGILLTQGTASNGAKDFVKSKLSSIKYIKALGGETRVSSSSLQELLMSSMGSSLLKVHFIDVGQGESILVQSPNGRNMLVDAGDDLSGRKVVSYLKSQGISKVDVLIGSHTDSSHIGGLDTVIYDMAVDKLYMSGRTDTNRAYDDVVRAANSKSLSIGSVYRGMNIDLGTSLTAQVVAPKNYYYSYNDDDDDYDDNDDYSVALRITYGSRSFLLTADAGYDSEDEMMDGSYQIYADVLKIGDHGSDYATSYSFLNRVNPKFGVLSAGKGSGYPDKETMDMFKNWNIPVYRTDESGTIVCISDGDNIVFNASPGSYAYYSSGGSSSVEVGSTVDIASPKQNSTVNLTVTGPAGGSVTAMCRFKGQDVKYTGTIGSDGRAVIPVQVGEALVGYTVYVDIFVEVDNSSSGGSKGVYFTQTRFTPQ